MYAKGFQSYESAWAHIGQQHVEGLFQADPEASYPLRQSTRAGGLGKTQISSTDLIVLLGTTNCACGLPFTSLNRT